MATPWIESGKAKRVMDLSVAIPALVFLAPVAAMVGLLVRLRLGAPVLFRQTRAGRHGLPISVPKFRSMTNEQDGSGQLLPDEDRLSRFGVRLRSSSLDELPQLWTVLRGEMSLIGPRPLPTAYVERYNDEQRRRLDAAPGITGWAQVNGRNATSWDERFELDLWYLENASLWLDLRILFKTITVAIRGGDVSATDHVTMHEFMG